MVKEKLNFNGRNIRPLLVILDFNLGITNYFGFSTQKSVSINHPLLCFYNLTNDDGVFPSTVMTK